MPPKVKISREDIIKTAVEIIRNSGEEVLNARNIAVILGCSTQPIFSNFQTMEELKTEVINEAKNIYFKYVNEKVDKNEFFDYKAESIAYITFAKVEPHLFKLLFLCEGDNILNNKFEHLISEETGLCGDTARLFNLEMWAFVHGMAAMTANASFPLHESVICRIFDDAYEGLKTRFNI